MLGRKLLASLVLVVLIIRVRNDDPFPTQPMSPQFIALASKCTQEETDKLKEAEGDKHLIDCCTGVMGRECLKDRCLQPEIQKKFEINCKSIDGLIKIPKNCGPDIDVLKCRALGKAWLWIVILVAILIVILGIAVLIYMVYSRKFRRPDKKNTSFAMANNINLESRIVVSHKKPKKVISSGNQRNGKKRSRKASSKSVRNNSLHGRTTEAALPGDGGGSSHQKINRGSLRKALA